MITRNDYRQRRQWPMLTLHLYVKLLFEGVHKGQIVGMPCRMVAPTECSQAQVESSFSIQERYINVKPYQRI